MLKKNLNMRKVKLADVFSQFGCKLIANQYLRKKNKIWLDFDNYGFHYYVNYQASIDNGIKFTIQKRIGKRYIDHINIFSSITEIMESYYQSFKTDCQTLTEYHTSELNYLGKVGFINSFIYKDKKDKIKYHEDKLQTLLNLQEEIEKYRKLPDEKKIPYYSLPEVSLRKWDTMVVIDIRDINNIKIEQVMVNKLIPFIDKKNQISLKIDITSFDLDKLEMINVAFTDNHAEIESGYHVFLCREKAYDFAIEELMKTQYKDKIKMRVKVAKKIDSIFG